MFKAQLAFGSPLLPAHMPVTIVSSDYLLGWCHIRLEILHHWCWCRAAATFGESLFIPLADEQHGSIQRLAVIRLPMPFVLRCAAQYDQIMIHGVSLVFPRFPS